ncbi:MAG: hypothetical protein K6F67_05540 [Oscillospiraceae bacterium]|nr:hypothetical protein [Oscillospiraceae bacterium]
MLTTVEGLLIALVCLVAVIAICAVVLAVRAGKPAPINVVSVPGTAVQYSAAPVSYAAPAAPAVSAAPAAPPTVRYGGEVKLNGVPDRVAAQLMAIVAEESGIPLEELRFISISERS